MRGARRQATLLCVALSFVGCADIDGLDTTTSAMNVAGPWALSPSARSIGDGQYVRYNGSPRIADGGRCTSTNAFACSCTHPACSRGLPGTLEFAAFLRRRFPQIRGAGGFDCCRQNTGDTAYLSVHSIGRAIDLSIPVLNGDANNTAGDAVANWLVEHAQEIGVQIVIWDRSSWRAERGAGDKLRPYTGPIPHIDHIHTELSLDGANRRTPFFTSGASQGGATCTPRCEGSRIVNADCSSGDCAFYGTACLADPTPRCGTPECPRTGMAFVCLDNSRRLECANGLIRSLGECGAYGAFCSTAGVATTAARCVFSLCVSGPTMAPYAHNQCSITPGRQLECFADGGAREVPCPSGQVCSMQSGSPRCVAPLSQCPVPPAGTPGLNERMVCLGGNTVARCINGNVYSVTTCGTGAMCIATGDTARCTESMQPGGDDNPDMPGPPDTPDAGMASVDAGRDAGTPVVDAGRDAGTVQVDAGRDAGRDAGPGRVDAGAAPVDAGVDAGSGGEAEDGGVLADGDGVVAGGCGCVVGGTPGGRGAGVWLALLALAGIGRRRRR